jgi:hypothetical protein
MARNPSRPDHSFSAAKPKEEAPADARGLPPTSPADGGETPDHVIGWPQKLIWRSGGSKKAEARRASPAKLNTIKIEADNQEGDDDRPIQRRARSARYVR